MRKFFLGFTALAMLGGGAAIGDYAATVGSGTNFASAVISSVHYVRQLVCDATLGSTCAKVVAGNSAGTTDVALVVSDPNVLAALQGAIPAGANTIGAVTQSGTWTTRGVGNGGGVLDAIGQNVAAPANWWQGGCQFNTTPTTITNGNGSPFQCDNGGRLLSTLQSAGPVAPGTAATKSNLNGGVYTAAGVTLTDGQQAASQLSSKGGQLSGSQYPAGATPITASATGTTGATTATLATGASVTTYICGFSIRANATAAATGNATVTGTITGTLNFTQWTAPTASGLGLVEMIFNPCIPASAVNTSIAVVSAAPGTGGVVSSSAWGYTLLP